MTGLCSSFCTNHSFYMRRQIQLYAPTDPSRIAHKFIAKDSWGRSAPRNLPAANCTSCRYTRPPFVATFLATHPAVTLHCTPAYSSELNHDCISQCNAEAFSDPTSTGPSCSPPHASFYILFLDTLHLPWINFNASSMMWRLLDRPRTRCAAACDIGRNISGASIKRATPSASPAWSSAGARPPFLQ